jgi:hypothetical protein
MMRVVLIVRAGTTTTVTNLPSTNHLTGHKINGPKISSNTASPSETLLKSRVTNAPEADSAGESIVRCSETPLDVEPSSMVIRQKDKGCDHSDNTQSTQVPFNQNSNPSPATCRQIPARRLSEVAANTDHLAECQDSAPYNGAIDVDSHETITEQESQGLSEEMHKNHALPNNSVPSAHTDAIALDLSTPANTDTRNRTETQDKEQTPRGMLCNHSERRRSLPRQQADAFLTSRRRPLPLQLNVPPACLHFVGRKSLLDDLADFMCSKASRQVYNSNTNVEQDLAASHESDKRSRIATICGYPGIGKTEIARQFVLRNGDDFDFVFWIRSDSQVALARSFHDAAIALQLIDGRRDYSHRKSTELCKSWFEQTTSPWLLVFDNVADFELLKTYLPSSSLGRVIITTRLSIGVGTGLNLTVPRLSREEGADLLLYLIDHAKKDIPHPDTVQQLLRVTEGLPVLFELGVLLLEIEIGRKVGKSDLEQLANSQIPDSALQSSTNLPQFLLRYTAMQDLSTQANEACHVFACLDYHDMDARILLAGASFEVPLRTLPMTWSDLNSCVQETTQHGLLRISSENSLAWKHELIQEAFHALMTPLQMAAALNITSHLLLSRWPTRKKFRNIVYGFWPEFDNLHNHVHRLCRLVLSRLEEMEHASRLITMPVLDPSFVELLTRSIW